jgi:hypothetical protein
MILHETIAPATLKAVGGGRPDLVPVFEERLTNLFDAMAPSAQPG